MNVADDLVGYLRWSRHSHSRVVCEGMSKLVGHFIASLHAGLAAHWNVSNLSPRSVHILN